MELKIQEINIYIELQRVSSNEVKISDFELGERNKNIEIDIMDMPSSSVIVISDGVVRMRELPPYGEYKIITHQGKVKRMRREEGEEI